MQTPRFELSTQKKPIPQAALSSVIHRLYLLIINSIDFRSSKNPIKNDLLRAEFHRKSGKIYLFIRNKKRKIDFLSY